MNNTLPDPEVIPDASLGRDHTFLTNMDVAGHDIFRVTGRDSADGLGFTKKSNFKGFDHDMDKASQRSKSPDEEQQDDKSKGYALVAYEEKSPPPRVQNDSPNPRRASVM